MKTRHPSCALIVAALVLTVLATTPVAAYGPTPGGEVLDRLRSPLFLAGTANSASTESVAADAFNPAASALKQRVHLNASYLALLNTGWNGHAANVGLAWPTRVGVFTGSLDLASASYPALALGTRGSLNLSFAKELYPNFLFGAGLRMHLAGGSGAALGFGGGLDVGIISLLGPRFGLADLRFGVALQQMGYNPTVGGTSGVPSIFTPVADIEATIVDTGAVAWSLHTGLSLPSFQNLRYRVGTALTILDMVDVRVGWEIDLREQLGAAALAAPLLPSVGLSVRLQTGPGRSGNPSEITTHAAWAPLYRDVQAAGAGVNVAFGVVDSTPPAITVDYPETLYISPDNDGRSDELLLPTTITDERFVTGWTLDISDGSGALVRRIENKEQRPEAFDLSTVIDRLLYVQTGVEIPETIRWDGRTDEGEVAADGTYTFVLEAFDDNGNISRTEPATIVVDATPPEIAIEEPTEADARIFSPNDDGNKDQLTIAQSGSSEDLWTIEIVDVDGQVVLTDEVTGAAPGPFTWDGRDAEGVLVPDGIYTYRIFSTDRAENDGSAEVANIIVDTEPTPIGLAVDIGHFSPNGDGVRDAVVLTPDVPVTEGITDWRYEVRSADQTLVRTHRTTDAAPQPWSFDGRDDAGRMISEGSLAIALAIEYRNGNQPRAEAPTVVLDVTAPRARVVPDSTVFSPNGDGRLDALVVSQEYEPDATWTATVSNAASDVVREWTFGESVPTRFEWDGRDGDGRALPDGDYRYTLTGVDRAGNRVDVSTPRVALDTRETPIFIAAAREAFSPNGNGVNDTVTLLPQIEDGQGIERFSLEILDASEAVVGRIDGAGVPESGYPWDGRGRTGRVVADGTYRIRLTVEYEHGNRPVAVSAPLIVDTVTPTVVAAATDTVFSPDGDGAKDSIEIAQTSSEEDRWEARIVAESGTQTVRTWAFTGSLSDLIWDGTDDDGEVVPDGAYRYIVSTTDIAGNRAVAETSVFRTDTRDVEVTLRASERAFSPNGDGVKDTVAIEPRLSVDAPVATWTLRMLDESGTEQFAETGRGAPTPVVWQGERTGGGRAAEGAYRAELSLNFERGDTVVATTPRQITLDVTAPTVDVSLSSEIISPNGDGRLDALEISQATSEEERWTAIVRNEGGAEVGRWEWIGRAPDLLRFGGLDTERRRVSDGQYTYEIAATDAAGNSAAVGPLEFEIYTAETPLNLALSAPAFSPNGDGVLDTLTLRPTVGDAVGLTSWQLLIESEDGTEVYRRTGTSMPAEIAWDGRGTGGAVVDEGTYVARLAASYRHGNEPTANAGPITLDVTAPELAIESTEPHFSPDGDSARDTITITQQTGTALSWRAAVTGADGEAVRAWDWNEAPDELVWDGTDVAGNVVPDGRYRYEISGADAAGNSARATIEPIRVDTRSARVFLTTNRRAFSPNGDGTLDDVTLSVIISRTDGVESTSLQILNSAGSVVATLPMDASGGRATVRWNGRAGTRTLPDGTYTARLTVAYDNGAEPVATTPEIALDTTAPTVALDLEGLPFSPDNDGLNDELGIRIDVTDRSTIARWELTILDRTRRPFQTFTGTGTPRERILWDGRGSGGDTVISAEDYPFVFTATDAVGNVRMIEGIIPIDILVVRDGDRLRVQIASITFLPNLPDLELNETTPAGQRNVMVLRRLVEIFSRYETYRIRIEGHAVNLTGTEREERESLQPLSLARAERIRTELIRLGMAPDRITTLGRGGTEPLVPHTDLDERWKNRRVEFILLR